MGHKKGIKKVVTLVSDFAGGHDCEKAFADEFKANGGEILDVLRVPLINPDFAPYLQRVRDSKPDAMFLWFPGVFDVAFSQQYMERGLQTSGINLIGVGDIVDDEVLIICTIRCWVPSRPCNIPPRIHLKRTKHLLQASCVPPMAAVPML